MLEFICPVSKSLLDFVADLSDHQIGKKITFKRSNNTLDVDILAKSIVFFSVAEFRQETPGFHETYRVSNTDFDAVRKSFYSLYQGDWNVHLIDLGYVEIGETWKDTQVIVSQIFKALIALDAIPVLLGGSQELAYGQYKAYQELDKIVNVVNIDAQFDIDFSELTSGILTRDTGSPLDKGYMEKILIEEPFCLFNYSVIGYQSYKVSVIDRDMFDQLYFDTLRLGELCNDLTLAEPFLRGADMVIMDLNAMQSSFYGIAPNGLTGREVCALARYIGISEQLTSFGIYNLHSTYLNATSEQLFAQILWYFIEGVNCRYNETELLKNDDSSFLHYKVLIENECFYFYKSKFTQRWWMKVEYFRGNASKFPIEAILACSFSDYELACNQIIPERWFKSKKKFEM